MKKRLLSLAIFVAVLSIQPFASTTALAQSYGESSYGGGVYNNQSTSTDNSELSTKEKTSADGATPKPSTTMIEPSQSETNPTDKDKNQINTDDTTATNDSSANQQDEKSLSNSFTLLKLVSLGAIVAALLLVIIALVIKKRRQTY